MVEVRSPDQTDVAGGVELAQDRRERNRIRSAGKGCHDARLAPKERMPANELPDAVQQHHGIDRTAWAGQGGRVPLLPPKGAGGRTRTVDLALMRRPL